MGRFLAFLLVFVLGGVIGFVIGGIGGGATGAYFGACAVIDKGVAQGTLSQPQANDLMKSIASELGLDPAQKQQIVDALKKSNAPPSPCQKSIEAL